MYTEHGHTFFLVIALKTILNKLKWKKSKAYLNYVVGGTPIPDKDYAIACERLQFASQMLLH